MPYADLAQKRAHDHEYHQRNREQRCAYQRAYRAAHRGRCMEYLRDYRESHRDELRRQREDNALVLRAQQRERTSRYREWLDEIRSSMVCIDCGSTEKLHFHHRDPATKEFALGDGYVLRRRALAEMQKCDVLCASCHSRRHALVRWHGRD